MLLLSISLKQARH